MSSNKKVIELCVLIVIVILFLILRVSGTMPTPPKMDMPLPPDNTPPVIEQVQ